MRNFLGYGGHGAGAGSSATYGGASAGGASGKGGAEEEGNGNAGPSSRFLREQLLPKPTKDPLKGNSAANDRVVTAHYEVDLEIGRETFGAVYLCHHKRTNLPCVCKVLDKLKCEEEEEVRQGLEEMMKLRAGFELVFRGFSLSSGC